MGDDSPSRDPAALSRPRPAPIRVGVAGWMYDDWAGVVHPAPAPREFDPLAYLAQYVDCVEVNSTFYRPPAPRACASWVRRTADRADFRFTVKLWRRFTHDRDAADFDRDARAFTDAVAPLYEAGRCGALLVQFPWSFKHTRENAAWVARVGEAFADLHPVVEVRHDSWVTAVVLDWFRAHAVGLCAIDQPLFEHSLEPGAIATGPVGYVRLHGRNRANWFREGAAVWERYDYLYDEAELDPWIARLREIADTSEEVFAITNNHYRGQAVVNALELKAALEGHAVAAPSVLRAAYPVLAGCTEARDAGAPGPQGDLFA